MKIVLLFVGAPAKNHLPGASRRPVENLISTVGHPEAVILTFGFAERYYGLDDARNLLGFERC
jgi:hypothetical protein